MVTRYDRLIIYLFILMAAFSFVLSGYVMKSSGKDATDVVVSVAGGTQAIYSLDKNRWIKLRGPLGVSTLKISSAHGVRVVDSPCPQKVCLARGWIKKAGEVVVCAPNKVVVRIRGEDESKIDAVSK